MAKLKAEDLKSLKILHSALTVAAIFLFVMMAYLVQSGGTYKHSTNSLLFIIAAIVLFVCILLGSKVYTANIKNALSRTFESYDDALSNFRATNIMRWAFIEGGINITSVLAFLDQNPYLFFTALIGIIYLFISKVNAEHFKNYNF